MLGAIQYPVVPILLRGLAAVRQSTRYGRIWHVHLDREWNLYTVPAARWYSYTKMACPLDSDTALCIYSVFVSIHIISVLLREFTLHFVCIQFSMPRINSFSRPCCSINFMASPPTASPPHLQTPKYKPSDGQLSISASVRSPLSATTTVTSKRPQKQTRYRPEPSLNNMSSLLSEVSPMCMYWSKAPVWGQLPSHPFRAHTGVCIVVLD